MDKQDEILQQLDDLKKAYLEPIRESQSRLEEKVKIQKIELDNCKEKIELVGEKLDSLSDEIAKRFKQMNRICVKNTESQAETEQLLEKIRGKKTDIYWIKEIRNNSKEPNLKSFVIELDAAQKQEILAKKTEFFKHNRTHKAIGVEQSLTIMQQQERQKAFLERKKRGREERDENTDAGAQALVSNAPTGTRRKTLNSNRDSNGSRKLKTTTNF